MTAEFLKARSAVIGSVVPGFSGNPDPYAGWPETPEYWSRLPEPETYASGMPRPPRQLVPARKLNFEWSDRILPALNLAGKMSKTSELLRPRQENLVDFRAMPGGRRYLEAAHVLAHWRYDEPWQAKHYFKDTYALAYRVRDCLAEIALAVLLDLPLELARSSRGFSGYGIRVMCGRDFDCPDLFVRDDRSDIADMPALVLVAGVFIEPLSVRVLHGLSSGGPRDLWCGMPSSVVFAGWETPDVIMNGEMFDLGFGRVKKYRRTISVMDLMPPCSIGEALTLLPETPDIVEGARMRVDDWLASPVYADMLAQTPPICRGCTAVNMRADETPDRPRGKDPGFKSARKLGKADPWRVWHSAISESHGILSLAWEHADWRRHGSPRAYRKAVRERKRAHRLKMTELNKTRQLMELERRHRNKAPTAAGMRKLSRLKRELGIAEGL